MKKYQAVLCAFFLAAAAAAQTEKQIICGQIAESDFTKGGEFHELLISIEPGTQLDVSLVPVGATLKLHAKLIEPTGNVISASNEVRFSSNGTPDRQENFVSPARIKSEAISSKGIHKIRVYNWNAGTYNAYVTCVLRSGALVQAGQTTYEPRQEPAPMPAIPGPIPAYTAPGLAAEMAPPPGPPTADQLLDQVKTDAGHQDIKTQLKAAALGFAKEQVTGWLASKLLKSGAGKILGKAAGGLVPGAQPLLAAIGPAVSRELLVNPAGPVPVASSAAGAVLQQALAPPSAAAAPPAVQAPPAYQAPAPQAPPALQAPAPQAPPVQAAPVAPAPGAPAPAQAPAFQPAPAVAPAVEHRLAAAESGTPPAVAAGMTLYAEPGFGGTGESFFASDPNLTDNPIGNDAVSSLRIRPGCLATLFGEIDFQGASIHVADDLVNLRDTKIGNGSVSSVKLQCPG